MRNWSREARNVRHQCVFPPPSALPLSSSSTQLTTNVQTVAGIISLLNDYLLSIGERQLDFLNPCLYEEGLPGINDITSGRNPGCGTLGFSATRGWDPVRPAKLVSLHARFALTFVLVLGDESRYAGLFDPGVPSLCPFCGASGQ